jgi:hypothetical protein
MTTEQKSAREDVLDMAYINSLPQPFIGRMIGGGEWPVNDFEVATGMMRIDICGLLQVTHIGEFTSFRDGDGVVHPAEGFYSDAIPEDRTNPVILPRETNCAQHQCAAVTTGCAKGHCIVKEMESTKPPPVLLKLPVFTYGSPARIALERLYNEEITVAKCIELIQEAEQRKPLSDDALYELLRTHRSHNPFAIDTWPMAFARAVEAFHGIKP